MSARFTRRSTGACGRSADPRARVASSPRSAASRSAIQRGRLSRLAGDLPRAENGDVELERKEPVRREREDVE
jgi:hypothetical protein